MGVKKAPSKSVRPGRQQGVEKKIESQGIVFDRAAPEPPSEERWSEDMAILRRAAAELAHQRVSAKRPPGSLANDNSFYGLFDSFGYSSRARRNEAVRSLYHNNPERVASFLKIALRDGSPEQRRVIGAALQDSGLVDEAINNLTQEKYSESYKAFSLLFLAAKSGVIQPLLNVIEDHPNVELRLKLIGLLVSSGVPEVLPSFRRLAVSNSLALELRASVVDAINQLNIQIREAAA